MLQLQHAFNLKRQQCGSRARVFGTQPGEVWHGPVAAAGGGRAVPAQRQPRPCLGWRGWELWGVASAA
eukprot:9233165-Pyramimonas_sp.AAC.1